MHGTRAIIRLTAGLAGRVVNDPFRLCKSRRRIGAAIQSGAKCEPRQRQVRPSLCPPSFDLTSHFSFSPSSSRLRRRRRALANKSLSPPAGRICFPS